MPGPPPTTPAPWLVLAVGNPSRGDDALGPELVERLRRAPLGEPGHDVSRMLSGEPTRHGATAATGADPAVACAPAGRQEDDVELLIDFQLQIEHALDLVGRQGVLFVDAALPGVVDEVAIDAITPDDGVPPASHALRPGAVLNVASRVNGSVPPAWQLAIEGSAFELGEGLSVSARRNLERAVTLAQRWLHERRVESDPRGGTRPRCSDA